MKDDDLMVSEAATQYRTESGSDRMLELNERYHLYLEVASSIRSLPLSVREPYE